MDKHPSFFATVRTVNFSPYRFVAVLAGPATRMSKLVWASASVSRYPCCKTFFSSSLRQHQPQCLLLASHFSQSHVCGKGRIQLNGQANRIGTYLSVLGPCLSVHYGMIRRLIFWGKMIFSIKSFLLNQFISLIKKRIQISKQNFNLFLHVLPHSKSNNQTYQIIEFLRFKLVNFLKFRIDILSNFVFLIIIKLGV